MYILQPVTKDVKPDTKITSCPTCGRLCIDRDVDGFKLCFECAIQKIRRLVRRCG